MCFYLIVLIIENLKLLRPLSTVYYQKNLTMIVFWVQYVFVYDAPRLYVRKIPFNTLRLKDKGVIYLKIN